MKRPTITVVGLLVLVGVGAFSVAQDAGVQTIKELNDKSLISDLPRVTRRSAPATDADRREVHVPAFPPPTYRGTQTFAVETTPRCTMFELVLHGGEDVISQRNRRFEQ